LGSETPTLGREMPLVAVPVDGEAAKGANVVAPDLSSPLYGSSDTATSSTVPPLPLRAE
jgi:hypothetical protein